MGGFNLLPCAMCEKKKKKKLLDAGREALVGKPQGGFQADFALSLLLKLKAG